jgi:hypothetical protein
MTPRSSYVPFLLLLTSACTLESLETAESAVEPLGDAPVVAKNGDGRLEVFALGSGGDLVHSYQTSLEADAPWSGWESLGGDSERIAVGQNGDGRLEVFARGDLGHMWHLWQTPGGERAWSDWHDLAGAVDDLAIARNADGRLEVFAPGSDKQMWHTWQQEGGWSAWHPMGGTVHEVAAAENADGRLEIFARGSDGGLHHNYQDPSLEEVWSGWRSLGRPHTGEITNVQAVRDVDGRLQVFATTRSDNALWSIGQIASGGWSSWRSLGGTVRDYTVALAGNGSLHVFARRADDGQLTGRAQVGEGDASDPAAPGWTPWREVPGALSTAPALAVDAQGRLNVFGRDADEKIVRTVFSGWQVWETIGE